MFAARCVGPLIWEQAGPFVFPLKRQRNIIYSQVVVVLGMVFIIQYVM